MSADVTQAFVRAAFARVPPDIALLVSVYADGLDEPLRASSWAGGLDSRGEAYPYMPFNFSWQGAGVGEVSRAAKLEIANVDGRISQAVRTAIGRPAVDVETDDTHASGTLSPRDFATEPACAPSYTPAKTPAAF
jgi:hypothetical protein